MLPNFYKKYSREIFTWRDSLKNHSWRTYPLDGGAGTLGLLENVSWSKNEKYSEYAKKGQNFFERVFVKTSKDSCHFLKYWNFSEVFFLALQPDFFFQNHPFQTPFQKHIFICILLKICLLKPVGRGRGRGGGLKALADLLIYIYLFFVRLPLLNKPILPFKIKWQSRRTSMAIGSTRPLGKCSKSGTVSIRLNQFLFHGMEYSILITINDKGSEE